jgi:hypothetical protein
MKELHGEASRSVVRKSVHAALASGPEVLLPVERILKRAFASEKPVY